MAIYSGFFPAWVMPVYLLRELWVLCIRRYVAEMGVNIPSSLAGKAKTNFVMWGFLPTFLSLSGVAPWAEPYLTWIAYFSFTTGMIFSYVSFIGYTRAFVAAYNGGPVRAGATVPPGAASGAHPGAVQNG